MDRVTSEPAGPNQDLDEPLDLCVVLPCHNVADTLAEQLEALTAERWRGSWTILVVDNRSTDGTAAVAMEYRERGVHLLAADEGSGVAYVRNAGAAAVASSRSVAFCDGDDVVQPGWVAALGDALEGHDLVSGVIDTQRLNPSWLARSRPMADSGEMPYFGGTPFASGGNCGIRMSLYHRLAGFDESFSGLDDI